MKMKILLKLAITFGAALMVASCYKPVPHNIENICDIFMEYPGWYADAKATEAKWGVPVPLQMAIIYEESGFLASNRPMEPTGKGKFAKIFPWKPASSAQGYCQALKGMWECYEQNMGKDLSRDDFAAASDFIGWYAHLANQMDHIDPSDGYDLYIAYHDGIGAFHSKSYWKNPFVMALARKVQNRAELYTTQLKSCEGAIPAAPASN